jgi:NitT/TauT family transport system permease protein
MAPPGAELDCLDTPVQEPLKPAKSWSWRSRQRQHRGAWFLGLLSLLGLWQLLALAMNTDLLLPGPWATFLSLLDLLPQLAFWQGLGASLIRALGAFALSVAMALPLGLCMGLWAPVGAFLAPWLTVLRSTPVISIILLALIWFSADTAPIWVCLLMVVPIIMQAVVEGVRSRDPKLQELARVLGLSPWRQLQQLIIPGLLPFFRAGGRSALGIGWKVIAAAEVLASPSKGLGTLIQEARGNLLTSQVLALTIALVLVAALGDLLLMAVLRYPHRSRLV